MPVLLKEIKSSSSEAASALEEAGFCTDAEIQSLTREDLHELFPGCQKLKLRKTVFEIIHKRKPIDVLLKELKDFIPHESFKAALTSNGVLVDYLHMLKEMKTQMNNVQDFVDAHIVLLEQFTKNQHQEPDKGSLADTGASSSSDPVVPVGGQTEDHPQGAQGDSFTVISPQDYQDAKVMYQMVVIGKNFDAHIQLLDKVKAQDWDRVQLIESNQDYKVIIVFCTICSRIGSDVEAAMCDVEGKGKGDKPVILVLMHHSREARKICPMSALSEYPQVVLQVNVFFHESKHGLLKCHQNNEAASKIQNKLLEYSIQGRKDSSGNALGVGGAIGPSTHDGGVTAPSTHGGGAIGPATHGGGAIGLATHGGGATAPATCGGSGSGGNHRVSHNISSATSFYQFFVGKK